MKRTVSRTLALVLTLCMFLSAIPFASAAQPFEPGDIDLRVCALELPNDQYCVTYRAGLVMLDELATAAAELSSYQELMRQLRFICTLNDDLVSQLTSVDEDDFVFDCAQWEGRNIFVYEDARLTDEGLKIYYKLDEQVLADWPTAKIADVKAALRQPMTMTATKHVSDRQMAQAGNRFYTTGTVELEGLGIEKFYGQYSVVGHEGDTRLFLHTSDFDHDYDCDCDCGCHHKHQHGGGQIWYPGGALGDCPRNIYCPAGHFVDLDLQLWYHDGIHFCAEHELMIGMTGTTFEPYTFINRAMVVTILYRMENTPAVTGKQVYSDADPKAWYGPAVEWGTASKVINGYGGNKFGPLDPITREQMAAILWRYAQYKGYDVSVGEDTNILSFHDAFEVSGYAIPAMQWACGAGMIQGANGYLMPLDTTTRAQAAAMIQRYCLNVADY